MIADSAPSYKCNLQLSGDPELTRQTKRIAKMKKRTSSARYSSRVVEDSILKYSSDEDGPNGPRASVLPFVITLKAEPL